MKDVISFYVGLFFVLFLGALVTPWAIIGAGAIALLFGLSKGIKYLIKK